METNKVLFFIIFLIKDPLTENKDYNNRNSNANKFDQNKDLVESLHVMFTLYHVFENNQNLVQNK